MIPSIEIMNRSCYLRELTVREQLNLKFRAPMAEAKSSRDVLLHLLLLCMRVHWRGEAADLRTLS